MIISWLQLWELIVLAILLFTSNLFSGPLGGIFHFLIARTLLIPRIGWFFERLLKSPLYLNAITKPIAWLISSSGLLIGLAIHNLFWGGLNTNLEYVFLLLFAIVAILEILNSIITFDAEYYYIDTIMDSMKDNPFFKEMSINIMKYSDKALFVRLARSAFVDKAIPQFFRLLISIGVSYYALANLNIIDTVSDSPLTIWDAIIVAFSLIDITGEIATPLTGTTWEIIRLISAFISFFWLVMFITLASASVDEVATQAFEKTRGYSESWVREIVESVITQREEQAASASFEATTPKVVIVEALVDPIERVDSGNETITLYNPANKSILIKGWQLEDSNHNRLSIGATTIGIKEKCVISIPRETIYLRNKHGYICLRDQDGTIIDRVEYDRTQIDDHGVVKWREY